MQRIALFGVIVVAFAGRSCSAHAGASSAPVVGGTAVEHGAFPDAVAVLGADGSLCSGTLIDADLVLTAAHCIETDPIEVIVGAIDLARPDGERRRVKWTRAYPSWLDRYDIGVVMLEHPVFEKARAIAAGCTGREHFAPGLALTVVGFGMTTKTGDDDNTQLHRATVPLVDATCTTDPACQAAVAPGGEFIAGGFGTDACFGDSGGPVYIETARGLALIGVVSRGVTTWGLPCADGGVYVRADKVVSWIQSVADRKLARVPCDEPADSGGDPIEAGGCSAAGALDAGFALYYAAVVLLCLRRRRRRAARS